MQATQYPQSYADLTLANLEEAFDTLPKSEAAPTGKDNVKTLCALAGLRFNDVWATWPSRQLNELATALKWYDAADMYKIEPRHRFEFQGKYYGFTENLSHISAGQWCDIEELNSNTENPYTQIRNAAAVLIRPVTPVGIREYDMDKAIAQLELFRQLPADVALGFAGFFLTSGKRLSQITREHSILRAAAAKMEAELLALPKNTAGITSFRRWLAETYIRLKLSRLRG